MPNSWLVWSLYDGFHDTSATDRPLRTFKIGKGIYPGTGFLSCGNVTEVVKSNVKINCFLPPIVYI